MKPSLVPFIALLAACTTGPDPSSTGGDAASILVAPVSSGSYVGCAALDGEGEVYVAVDQGQDQGLYALSFAPGFVLPTTWSAPASDPEIELSFAGETLWWAANNGPGPSVWNSPASAFMAPTAVPLTFVDDGASDVVGLVADGTGVYAAVSSPPVQTSSSPPFVVGPSPDSWAWPGTPAVDTAFVGSIYRIIPTATPPVARLGVTGITFFSGFMQHVLAQSTTDVYWADSTLTDTSVGRVMGASKAGWTSDPGHLVGVLPFIPNLATGFVGLAANDTYVAWAQAPEPYYGAQDCWVYASATKAGLSAPAKTIFDSSLSATPFSCSGLAVDADYAYFAMVQVAVPPAGAASSILLGTGIGRVPLAGGGALETVSLQSDRWYGPRRVLVDDTYVYAIDPSYVLRFPKASFGP